MIRSVLYLEPKDGDYDAVVEFFRRDDVLGRALEQPGCLGSELHVPTSGSGPILVTALWEDEDAYQGWVTSPVRAANTEPLARAPPERPGGVDPRRDLHRRPHRR